MRILPSKACGKMVAPPSKSMAHRHLICAALAEGRSVVDNIDLSEDIKATISCLESLGADFDLSYGRALVGGVSDIDLSGIGASDSVREFHCNESGSTLRFFMPIASVFGGTNRFYGSRVLLARPLSAFEGIFASQGIGFIRTSGYIETSGTLHGGVFSMPGNISSQFVTGLLFALPLLKEDSMIVLTDSIESRPYIEMTLQVQRMFGVYASWIKPDMLSIPGGQHYSACRSTVEGDWSNAAFFYALNAIGGDIEISGLDQESLQGDKVIKEMLDRLSCGFATLDISDCPDLGPVLLAVSAACHGGEFLGTRRLAIKESNRGLAMCQELGKLGVKTIFEENRIVVHPGGLTAPREPICGHNDHRIVMAMATLLTLTGGELEGEDAVRKSLPDYFTRLAKLGIEMEILRGMP